MSSLICSAEYVLGVKLCFVFSEAWNKWLLHVFVVEGILRTYWLASYPVKHMTLKRHVKINHLLIYISVITFSASHCLFSMYIFPMQGAYKVMGRLNKNLQHIKRKLTQLRLTVCSTSCHEINLKDSLINVPIISLFLKVTNSNPCLKSGYILCVCLIWKS